MAQEIYLFCGDEDFLKEEASKEIISKHLPPQSYGLNCDIYNAKDNYKDIFDTLNTLPFLSETRIVIIKNVECLPEPQKKSLLVYLKNSHKHICLIMESKQAPLNDKFIKSLSHYARVYSFKRLKRYEVRNWIYKRLNQYKKGITRGAADLLLELKGTENLAIIAKELEKLVTYKGENGEKYLDIKKLAKLLIGKI